MREENETNREMLHTRIHTENGTMDKKAHNEKERDDQSGQRSNDTLAQEETERGRERRMKKRSRGTYIKVFGMAKAADQRPHQSAHRLLQLRLSARVPADACTCP